MCFTKPKTPQPGAQPAPPAAAGADTLVLGPTAGDDEQLRNQGLLGRLALKIGRYVSGKPGPGGSPSVGGGVGGVGSGTGSSTSGGSTSSPSSPAAPSPSSLGVGVNSGARSFGGGGPAL